MLHDVFGVPLNAKTVISRSKYFAIVESELMEILLFPSFMDRMSERDSVTLVARVRSESPLILESSSIGRNRVLYIIPICNYFLIPLTI